VVHLIVLDSGLSTGSGRGHSVPTAADACGYAQKEKTIMSDSPQARIAAIRERLKGVDPEGWGFYVEDERPDKDCDYRVYRNDGAWGVCKPTHSSQHQRKADAEFIAAAPSDITFLLDAIASAQAAQPSVADREEALKWAESAGQRLEISDRTDMKPDLRERYAALAKRDMTKARAFLKLTLAEVPHV
jgi:hypothetical protein